MLVDSKQNSTVNFDFDVVKINGRRMTLSIFKQLFSQQPFNKEYELIYDLKAKIYYGKQFVLFSTPTNIRKFEITPYIDKIRIKPLDESIYYCLHENLQSLELEHFKNEIYDYYADKLRRFEKHSDGYEILKNLLYGSPETHYTERENTKHILINYLEDDFKNKVLTQYQKGVNLIENRNKLADIFKSIPQIFL